MTELSMIISVLNLAGVGGVGIFLYYLYRGLQERIKTLTELTTEQNKTLDAVRVRAEEADRLAEGYKRAVVDVEEMPSKLDERRNMLVKELEDANKKQQTELSNLKSLELQEIELKRASLERLPALEQALTIAVDALQEQLKVLTPRMSLFYAGHPYEGIKSEEMIKQSTIAWLLMRPEVKFFDIGDEGSPEKPED